MNEHTSLDLDLSRVVAISGHDGVGKSTLAKELANSLGGVVVSLADPLKVQAAQYLGIPEEVVRAKPTPPHLRDFMRALGYAKRQEHGEDYWIKQWYRRTLNVLRDGAPWVICDDMRHVNEFEFMDKHGAVCIALARAGTEPDTTIQHPPIISEVWDIRARILRRTPGISVPSTPNFMALTCRGGYRFSGGPLYVHEGTAYSVISKLRSLGVVS